MADSDDTKVVPMGAPAEVLGRSLAREVGRRRMELILDRPDAPALVKALPAEDLYYLIKDVGLDDGAALVALASPEQFQSFLDLDAWRPREGGAALDRDRVIEWLATARHADRESQVARLAGMDLEVLETVLRSGLLVVDRREEEERPRPLPLPEAADGEEVTWQESPDGNFWIAFTRGGPEGLEIRRILEDLYEQGAFGAARFLAALKTELDTELEHHAERFRNARMEDMGFPPPDLAASLYARVDPDAPAPPQPAPVEEAPGFFLAGFSGRTFLDQAAARVTGVDARTRLDRSLMYLANQVMVADAVDPSEVEQVQDAVGRMRAYLNLGLFRLAGGDPEAGGRLLAEVALKHLFQVGFTQTLAPRWRAERLVGDLGVEPNALPDLFEPPLGAVLHALLAGRRPRVAVALDLARAAGWPEEAAGLEAAAGAPLVETPEGVRPFAEPADLAAVDAALDRAEALATAARAAGLVEPPELGPEAGPGAMPVEARAATAALSALAGGAFEDRPLDPDALQRGAEAALDTDGRPTPALEDVLRERLAGDAGATLAAAAAARLARELGEARRTGAPLDPRFVTAVRVAESP